MEMPTHCPISHTVLTQGASKKPGGREGRTTHPALHYPSQAQISEQVRNISHGGLSRWLFHSFFSSCSIQSKHEWEDTGFANAMVLFGARISFVSLHPVLLTSLQKRVMLTDL